MMLSDRKSRSNHGFVADGIFHLGPERCEGDYLIGGHGKSKIPVWLCLSKVKSI